MHSTLVKSSGFSSLNVHSGCRNFATSGQLRRGYNKQLTTKLEYKPKCKIGNNMEAKTIGGVVVVNPKPNKALTSKLVDWLEKFIVKLMYDSSQPLHWLSHNFAPVHETPPSEHLSVIGHLPECLNGEFVRVGPNPKFPPVAGYHWLDGIIMKLLRKQLAATHKALSGQSKNLNMVVILVYGVLNASQMVHSDPQQPLNGIQGMRHSLKFNSERVEILCSLATCEITNGLPIKFRFDGDGMIHGLRIKDGKPTYVSRYVRTSRLKQEEYFGESKFTKIGDLKGLFGFLVILLGMIRTKLKVLDLSYGNGTGNTSLIYHHGKLLALSEGDKPYVIKVLEDGDLQTLGLMDYDQKLCHNFTAHPKIDPVTGEMFAFGYSRTPPYVTYRVISRDGVMNDPVQITVPETIMMHDFAITQNYAIFMDLPLYFRPKEMVTDKKFSYAFDATKKARFGILPRYAKDELHIKWFELPTCFIFHNANAWEEGEEVVLISCRLQNPYLDMVGGGLEERADNFANELYEMRFNLETGLASQRKLSESAIDFPRVNHFYTGRKQRYVYATKLEGIGKVTGIVKFDLQAEHEMGKTKVETGGNIEGIYELGPGRFGSEAIFVPNQPGLDNEEDDGYLIFFIHDENTGKSSVTVIDAKTMSPNAVAVVALPHRVPYGFHAFFVTEEQIQEQF